MRTVPAWLLVLLLAPALPAASDGVALIDEVIAMLEADVAEQVILDWLERDGRRPAKPDAERVIALTRAGATEELIRHLIRLSGEEQAAGAASPAVPTPGGGGVPVSFTLRYSPDVADGEESDWGLYVYLDGHPLAWSAGTSLSFLRDTLRFSETLVPGRHVVRLSRERHGKRKGGFRHEARVCGEVLDFEVVDSSPTNVTIEINEMWIPGREGGPLSWSVANGGGRIAGGERVGAGPESWPALCDDVEAGVDPAKGPKRSERRLLDGCVRWPALWPGLGEVPDRAAVLAELERVEFRPVPASARAR